MERLNYIGCKHTLIDKISDTIQNNVPDLKKYQFADLFAGTGTVGFSMKDKSKNVISNDMEYYSYVINYALLKCKYTKKIQKTIDLCNELEGKPGLIYENFSPNENCERMFFTNENAKKCDAILIFLKNSNLSKNEYFFLLASLVVQIDKVANTTSVYGAYLKKFKKSALKKMILKPIHKESEVNPKNEVYNQDVSSLVIGKKFDVVYLDPPYNSRQYAGNYSPLNYICRYSDKIELKGKTGLIADYNKSVFCSKTKVKSAFEDLISSIDCIYLILSYNDEGILNSEDIRNILSSHGTVELIKIKYKKFKSNNSDRREHVYEYLWVLEKKNKFKK